jgi:hypothetical protein
MAQRRAVRLKRRALAVCRSQRSEVQIKFNFDANVDLMLADRIKIQTSTAQAIAECVEAMQSAKQRKLMVSEEMNSQDWS